MRIQINPSKNRDFFLEMLYPMMVEAKVIDFTQIKQKDSAISAKSLLFKSHWAELNRWPDDYESFPA